MGGGAMWRSVIRVVGSTPTTAASNAVVCRMCTTAPTLKSPSSARIACTCPPEVQHSSNQVSPLKQYLDHEEWEFAGDEERDHLVFGQLPSQVEVEEASSDLQQALRLGILPAGSTNQVESPRAIVTSSTEVQEASVTSVMKVEEETNYHVVEKAPEFDWIEPAPFEVAAINGSSESGGRGAMLEAFHQFQHNPQVQKLVVSLATDKGVWDAVLANEQIQKFRHSLRESDGVMEDVVGTPAGRAFKMFDDDINIFSQIYWNTKKAFTYFLATLQELIAGIFDVAEKKMFLSETDDYVERVIRSSTMLAILVLSLVLFKRSALRGA